MTMTRSHTPRARTPKVSPTSLMTFFLAAALIILAPTASAALTDGLVHGYEYEGDADDVVSTYDGVITGATNTSGKVGSGLEYDGAGDEVSYGDLPEFGDADLTVSAWFWSDGIPEQRILHKAAGSPNRAFYVDIEVGGALELATGDGSSYYSVETTGTDYSDSSWHHLVYALDVDYNATHHLLKGYVDGSEKASLLISSAVTINNNAIEFYTGSSDGSRWYNGVIDEVYVWNRVLNSTERSLLYNGGSPVPYPFVFNSAPIVALTAPADNLHTSNTTTLYQASISDPDDDPLNCSLTLNGTVRNATSTTGLVNLSWPATPEGRYSWTVNCTDGEADTAATPRTVFVDRTLPLYSWGFPAADNTSEYDRRGGVVAEVYGEWEDTYLYALNASISRANGTVVESWNSTGLATTSAWTNHSWNTSGLSDAAYTYRTCAVDDHTRTSIPDLVYYSDGDELTFEAFGADVTITPLFASGGVEVSKEPDRYSWTYSTGGGKGKYSFTLTSTEPLVYRGSLYDYPVFVTGLSWVDFRVEGPEVTYKAQRKSDFEYELELEVEERYDGELDLRSLGGLNVACEEGLVTLTSTSLLTVRVKDNTTGLYVSSFNATLANGTAKESSGEAVVFTLTPGAYDVTLDADGYDSRTVNLSAFPAGEYNETVLLDRAAAEGAGTTGLAVKEASSLIIGLLLLAWFLYLSWWADNAVRNGARLSWTTVTGVLLVGALGLTVLGLADFVVLKTMRVLYIAFTGAAALLVYHAVKSNY